MRHQFSGVEALPAYRFGHDMHENDRYRNRSWNEAAGDLKVLWEAHVPEGPHWESSSPAIRLGWDSSSPATGDDRKLTAWEHCIDALRHGWERIRIGNDLDEAEYRRHHADTYPGTNYEDFAPVYRYGNNTRRRSVFQGLGWDDVESALRAEWERGHREGKPATWDAMKAALHRGWDQPKH
ncbi:MAG: hypothetical protein EOP92_15340 [Lysobacteraceae bacterium]|nr:MAG: hypothetical protein EOP92_15340 [Xanthomonadaceae bacterium]